jgi:hypothetical protein
MRRFFAEAMIAVLAILAGAEVMQMLVWLSVQFHEPLDKMFIAASCICYTVFGVALLMGEE